MMPNYQEMYRVLFREVTRVIEQLQAIQRETEELYMDSGEAPVVLIKQEGDFHKSASGQDGTYKRQPRP